MSKFKFESKEFVELVGIALSDEKLSAEYKALLENVKLGTITKKSLTEYTGTGYGILEKVVYSPLQYAEFIPEPVLIKGLVFAVYNGGKVEIENLKVVDIEQVEITPEFIPENDTLYTLSKDKKFPTMAYRTQVLDKFNQVLLIPVVTSEQCRLMTFDSMANLRPEIYVSTEKVEENEK